LKSISLENSYLNYRTTATKPYITEQIIMAIKSTIFKVQLNIADMDRHYYADHNLTIARHPSETDLRMMVRLVAFALNADEQLSFTKGISTDDEPDLWNKSLSDEIVTWIDLGQPDEKRIRQACGKSQRVKIYTYQERPASVWRGEIEGNLSRFNNLDIIDLSGGDLDALANLAERNLQLSAMISDGELTFTSDAGNVTLLPNHWFPAH